MPHLRSFSRAVGAVLLASCGGGGAAPDAGPCWPLASEPGGQVELGTGEVTFQPVSTNIELIKNASQSDPYFLINARIRGIPPGNPDDFFDPTNPRTKVTGVIEGIAVPLGVECPATIAYVPSPEPDASDMLHALRIGIGPLLVTPEEVVGKQIMLTVEVVGSNGLYAKDQRSAVIFVTSGPMPDAGVDSGL